MDSENAEVFKICSLCGHIWKTRDDFLSDPQIRLGGYQARLKELVAGIFLFTHVRSDCKTTLGLRAEVFADLYDGPIFTDRLTDTESCPQYCKKPSELDPCPNKCECAFVREILQIVKDWSKRGDAAGAAS